MPSIAIPEKTKQGYALANDGDGVYINRPHQKRGYVQKGMIQTLKTSCADVGVVVANGLYTNCSPDFVSGELKDISRCIKASSHDAGITDGIRIRRLTPLECWRLMGYTDDDYLKASEVNCNSQLYKQAGNGIVKHVAMAIFSTMFQERSENMSNMNEWIPTKERLPEYDGQYLVCFDDEFVATASYITDYKGKQDWELWADSGEPVAWMQLPEPYKAKRDN